MATTSEHPPKYDVNDPEQQVLAQEEGKQTPEAIEKPETPEEKMIRDFDAETDAIQKQKESLEGQVSRREAQIRVNERLRVPSSVNEGVKRDIEALTGQVQPLAEDLQKREPSAEEIAVQQQIDGTDARILRIKKEQETSPDVPASIKQGREKDIEDLQKEKEQQVAELQGRKLERIKKYQAEKEGAVQEGAPQAEANEPLRTSFEIASERIKNMEKTRNEFLRTSLETSLRAMENGGNLSEQNSAQIGEWFQQLTGKNLEAEADARARQELGQELAPEQVDFALNGSGDYGGRRLQEIRQAKMQEAIDAGGKVYGAENMSTSILQNERQKLEKQGISVSEVAFLQLKKGGADIKRAGLLSRLLGRTAKLVYKDGRKPQNLSLIELSKLQSQKEREFEEEVGKEFDGEISRLKDQASKVKGIHVRGLMAEAISGISPAAEAKPEAPAAAATEEIPAEQAPGQAVPEAAPVPEAAAESPKAEITPEQTAEMAEMKEDIASAANMDQLIDILQNGFSDYNKKDGNFTFPALVKGIVSCLREKNPDYVTRSFGLRKKVMELAGIKPAKRNVVKLPRSRAGGRRRKAAA